MLPTELTAGDGIALAAITGLRDRLALLARHFPAGVFVVAVIATTLETEFVIAGAATQGAAANNAKTNKASLLISSSNSRLQHR